jgi:hypothetical protein
MIFPMNSAFRTFFAVAAVFALAATAYASPTIGSIDPAYKYAWSNVGGYVNFAPSQAGLTITDTGITGYAWSANTGYINFDTNLSGVTNDGEGNLAGFAWDEGAGWISFAGVTIDANGQFHGIAQGGTVNGAPYQITFDCSNCDVRTDWRPVSVRGGEDADEEGGGSGRSGQRTQPPQEELPAEPTMPPPAPGAPGGSPIPGAPTGTAGEGGGTAAGDPGAPGGNSGLPGWLTGDQGEDSASPGTSSPGATSTPGSGMHPALVIAGTLLALLVLGLLVWLVTRRRDGAR